MADEGDDGAKYKFTPESDPVPKTTSKGHSGKAVAEYPNGDKYEGYYNNGTR
jgi:hypothetical protein